jgi:hypothetical protein
MNPRRVLPVVLITTVRLPLTASANAGTPLLWAGFLHLLFGSAILGIVEGTLIAWLFHPSRHAEN